MLLLCSLGVRVVEQRMFISIIGELSQSFESVQVLQIKSNIRVLILQKKVICRLICVLNSNSIRIQVHILIPQKRDKEMCTYFCNVYHTYSLSYEEKHMEEVERKYIEREEVMQSVSCLPSCPPLYQAGEKSRRRFVMAIT